MAYIGKKPADIIATAVDTTTGTFSGDLTVDTNTLYVDSANNRVGVGTTSLTNVLHVHQTDATSNSYVHITQADGGSGGSDGLSIGIEDGGVNAVIRNRENGYLRMYTNNTERMRITSGGDFQLYEDTGTTPKLFWDSSEERLGIGTSSPNATLQVDGTLTVRSSSNQAFNDSSNANNLTMNDSKAHFNLDGVDKDFQVSSNTVTNALFVQGSNGNVGIGTASPISKLDVTGAIEADDKITIAYEAGSSDWELESTSGDDFTISRNGSQKLLIDGSTSQTTLFGGLYLSSANLILANGNGIDFSANGNAGGMTSELLDDYEEGTFTPVFTTDGTDFTQTSTSTGTYTKIGNKVTVHLIMVLSASSGASGGTGNVLVTGLPFTVSTDGFGVFASGRITLTATLGSYIGTKLSTTQADVKFLVSGANPNTLLASQVNGNITPFFTSTITYFTS